MDSTNSLVSMSKRVIFERSFLIEHDEKLFRYTEKIEELTRITNIETIDLTMDDPTKTRTITSAITSSPVNKIPAQPVAKKLFSATNNRIADFASLVASPPHNNGSTSSVNSNTPTTNIVNSNTSSNSPAFEPLSPYWPEHEMGVNSPPYDPNSPMYSFDNEDDDL